MGRSSIRRAAAVGTAYKEGNALLTQLTTNTNRSYERKPGGASVTLQDTGDNVADFVLLNGTPPNLPNPQNIVLTAAPAAVDFGIVMPPATSVQTVTIKNVLLAEVTLTPPFAISGGDAAEFSVGAPGTTTLGAGAETTALVTFAPVSLGAKSASLTVTTTNGGTRTVTVVGPRGVPGDHRHRLAAEWRVRVCLLADVLGERRQRRVYIPRQRGDSCPRGSVSISRACSPARRRARDVHLHG